MFESRRTSVVSGLATLPTGAELAAALEPIDPEELGRGEHVDMLAALARQTAHAQARLLQGMAAVAARSTGVGFDSDEVAFALHLTRRGAQNQVALAQDLLTRLPMVWVALDRGELCLARARVFSDVLIVASDEVARDVATRVLPSAGDMTAGQLRARLQKELLTADPDAARERYERSVSERRVCLSPNDDTTACLSGIFLPSAKAVTAFERVDALARGLKRDGDTRTLDQLRADVFCDLLAGVDCGATAIARAGVVELLVPLETLIRQSDAPAHLAGYGPVIADIARQVAARQADQEATQRRADARAVARGQKLGESLASRWRYRVYDSDGQLLYAGTTRARPTAPDDDLSPTAAEQPPLFSPTEFIAEPMSHQPDEATAEVADDRTSPSETSAVDQSPAPDSASDPTHDRPPKPVPGEPSDPALGDAPKPAHDEPPDPAFRDTDRRTHGRSTRRSPRVAACRGEPVAPGVLRLRPLDPCPPPANHAEARFPDAATRRWIAARDDTCRAPGCTNPARTCDTDHTVDYALGGPTSEENLGLLCRHHHRLKHEGGYRLHQPQPGHFVWESPDGHFYRRDPDPPL
ncbi:MAG: DUF222 domain-containing protein [Hamadaea sp.]|uniref:HNH endonuclease signature motif containing protein n=1 Tax=Hamadaea sp. TaxID=2024425 RepID=UPI0017AE1483|nr:hypothetical protein [Hamadaea sp.]NUR69336.1 DUF222 domain-containing protein [Hamadaea sp.]NUT17785.1 DUF222 domain-containing protein [Hamadaea sp.]